MKITKNQLQNIIKEEVSKILSENAIGDYRKELAKYDEAERLRRVARQAQDYYLRSGEKYHLKRKKAALKKAKELNPSGKAPDRASAMDAYDAKRDGGDVIIMNFDDSDEDIDVNAIVDDELDAAFESDPRYAAFKNLIEDINFSNGQLTIELKTGSSDSFPEEFWERVEQNINDAIANM
jgi:hypothetical protein